MSFAYLTSTPGLSTNYSLYAVPAGWLIAMSPLWWAISAANGGYNNAKPKESWGDLEGKIDNKLYGRISRAIAANVNDHTNLPLFAAALVAGNVAHVDTRTLHTCAAYYLCSRIAYNFAYTLIEDETWSYLRSALYLSGVGSCLTLFVRAADKYKSLPW